ncbi:MAG: hypothetical protein GY804_08395 [Alphaproteobacteria bacterium]|nr:hypothetical protein [Alphaproteobacteria bacterium]
MPAFSKVTVIYNPVAGAKNGSLLHDVCKLISSAGIDVVMKETSCRGDGYNIACGVLKDVEEGKGNTEAIVAAGGDGTIAEVATALVKSQEDQKQILPLGIIPMGTANVLAIEIGLKKQAQAIVDAIVFGKSKQLYPCKVEPEKPLGSYFFLMAGIGFDADVVDSVNLKLKSKIGKLAYVCEAFNQAVKSSTKPVYEFVDDADNKHKAASAILCKGRFYAGKFLLVPDADIADKSLYVCLLKNKGLINLLRYGLGFVTGKLLSMKDVELIKTKTLSISGSPCVSLQFDGDKGVSLPEGGAVKISVCEQPIKIIVP